MAELTGVPVIDAHIERFRDTCGSGRYGDPALAAGACITVNDAFVRQLAVAGIDARSSDQTQHGRYPIWPFVDSLGYHDRTIKGCDAHVVAIVEHDGQRFSVDWSASQYGYQHAFPLVQRHVGGDAWEREWAV